MTPAERNLLLECRLRLHQQNRGDDELIIRIDTLLDDDAKKQGKLEIDWSK